MIELRNETPLTLNSAARMFPPNRRGRPVSLSCILRWVLDGVRLSTGEVIRLEALRVGGRWLTTLEAIQRFAERQTPRLDSEPGPSTRTPTRRERASQRAAQRLEEMGI